MYIYNISDQYQKRELNASKANKTNQQNTFSHFYIVEMPKCTTNYKEHLTYRHFRKTNNTLNRRILFSLCTVISIFNTAHLQFYAGKKQACHRISRVLIPNQIQQRYIAPILSCAQPSDIKAPSRMVQARRLVGRIILGYN